MSSRKQRKAKAKDKRRVAKISRAIGRLERVAVFRRQAGLGEIDVFYKIESLRKRAGTRR